MALPLNKQSNTHAIKAMVNHPLALLCPSAVSKARRFHTQQSLNHTSALPPSIEQMKPHSYKRAMANHLSLGATLIPMS